MSKSAEKTENTLLDWALLVPMAAIGEIGAVFYGVACMVKWAVITAIGKGNRV